MLSGVLTLLERRPGLWDSIQELITELIINENLQEENAQTLAGLGTSCKHLQNHTGKEASKNPISA